MRTTPPQDPPRQGKISGKSDPIDADLAVLSALRLDTTQLPIPRADGDREALWDVYITRQLYRTLTATMTPTSNNPAVA